MYKTITQNTLKQLNERIKQLKECLKYPLNEDSQNLFRTSLMELENIRDYMLNCCDYKNHKDNKGE